MSLQTLDRTQWSFAEALAHVRNVTVARRAGIWSVMRVSVVSVLHDRSGRAGSVANSLRCLRIVHLTVGHGGG